MKLFRQLLLIFIIAAMTVFAFGCSKKDDTSGKSDSKTASSAADSAASDGGSNDEKSEAPKGCTDADATVTGFMDAMCALDFAKAETYMDGELDIPYDNITDAKSQISDGLKALSPELGDSLDDNLGMMEDIAKAYSETMSYKIVEATESGDKYVYTMEITAADMQQVSGAGDSDIDDFTSSLEEGDFGGALDKVFEGYGEEYIEEIKNAPKKTSEFQLMVRQLDGKWVIDSGNSQLDVLEETADVNI